MERYHRQVYYYETDKMAIVHNANYLRIFEEARMFYMDQLGLPYKAIEDAGILIPVGDEFFVDVKLSFFNGIKMVFEYEIHRKGDEELITTGHSSHCFIDENTRRPLSLKRRMPDAYELVINNMEKTN